MPQSPSPRPWTIRLFFVLSVIVFGLFNYFVQHYQHVPGGGSFVGWNARGVAISMAGATIGLWVILWLNRRYSR